MRRPSLRLPALCLFATPALLLAGCSDLGAIRDMSARLTAASSSWNDVGGDIAGSCAREQAINALLADCSAEQRATDGLAAVNGVLGAYFSALFNAANESNFTIQPGLDQMTQSVSAIPGIDSAQVSAVSGLFGLLARLVTEGMREATLRDLINDGAPPARTIVQGMDGLVGQRLNRRLDTERIQLTSHFARLILTEKDAVGTDPPALCKGSKSAGFSGTGLLLTLEYCRRLAVVDQRIAALAAYRDSLKSADTVLAELQSAKTKLKTKALAKRLYTLGAELDEKITALRKAFA